MINKILHKLFFLLDESNFLFFKKVGYKLGVNFIHKRYATYSYKGILLNLNPLNYIDRRLIKGIEFEPELEKLITGLIEGEIFIDIGANFGLFSLMAASRKVDVVAFEPSSKELALFYSNLAINNFERFIKIMPVACGSEIRTTKLFLGPDRNTGLNSIVASDGSTYVDILELPLDNILPLDQLSHVRLIKIDVEGYEVNVLRGMKRVLLNVSNTAIVVEITPGVNEPEEIYALMDQCGFKAKHGINLNAVQYNEVFIN